MFKNIFYIAVIAGILFSCSSNSTKSTATDTIKKTDTSVAKTKPTFNRKYNDYARYMAGLPLEKGNVIGHDDSSHTFDEHMKSFNERWEEMDKTRLSKMREWAKTELNSHIDPKKNVYYPFSGADFLHAQQLFPEAKRSLYIANEPVGNVPDLENMTAKDRVAYLHSIARSLQDIFKRSYFITGRMITDIKAVQGVIPVFMVFMARTGMDVLHVELIDLETDAKIVVRSGNAKQVEGVRITYCPTGKSDDIRVLEYFNCDASNGGMKARPQVLQYVKSFGGANVFFKAASYLMHNPGFWNFKDASLEICDAVIQDDTGLPFRFLKKDYNFWLYGKYVRPISDFGGGGYQTDLAKAYEDPANVKPLPFSLGYHWWNNNQNYMCFVKKSTP